MAFLLFLVFFFWKSSAERSHEEWCGTDHPHDHPINFNNIGGSTDETCGKRIDCDAPRIRDLYSVSHPVPTVVVRTWWTVMLPNNNTSPTWKEENLQIIEQNMQFMNKIYSTLSISFTHQVDFVWDPEFTGIRKDEAVELKDLYAKNWRTHMNIFVTEFPGYKKKKNSFFLFFFLLFFQVTKKRFFIIFFVYFFFFF